ncbi:DMT family transporter [Gallibacterium melopsittaci]|uniref:DMT family transporter n=1 Tax=Gallibacterium melopsittaci TaxID=516063 RepID=A0ABV6HVJ3_9PAST
MFLLFIAIAIWGSSLPIGKLAYHSFEPVILVQFRFCIAALIILPTFIRVLRKIPQHLYKNLAILSFLNYPLVFLLQFIGLKYTSASSAVTMLGLQPLIMVFVGHLFFKEKASKFEYFLGLLAFIGISLVVSDDDPNSQIDAWGCFLILSSTITFAFTVRWAQQIMKEIPPRSYTAITIMFGMIFCLPFTLLLNQQWHFTPSIVDTMALLYLGIACSWLAPKLWNNGLPFVSANISGVISALEPIFGILFAILFLHEQITWKIGIGITLVLGVTLIFILYSLKKPPHNTTAN